MQARYPAVRTLLTKMESASIGNAHTGKPHHSICAQNLLGADKPVIAFDRVCVSLLASIEPTHQHPQYRKPWEFVIVLLRAVIAGDVFALNTKPVMPTEPDLFEQLINKQRRCNAAMFCGLVARSNRSRRIANSIVEH